MRERTRVCSQKYYARGMPESASKKVAQESKQCHVVDVVVSVGLYNVHTLYCIK